MPSLEAPLLDAPPLARHGLPELVKPETPAAGANFTQPVDSFFFVRLLAVSFRLATSADVADRTAAIEFRDDGDVRTLLCGNPVTVSASETIDYVFSVWQPEGAWPVQDTILSPLAPLLLMQGHDWRIVIENIQATDAITRIRYWQERFATTGQPS